MLTISDGKTLGECLPIATDRAEPVSMSLRTSDRVFASALLSVCSDRIVSERSSDRPLLIIVANCRDMTARSLSLTLSPLNPGIFSSRFIPVLVSVMETGAKPIPFSLLATSAGESASSVPLTILPARSRTEYAYVVAMSSLDPVHPRTDARSSPMGRLAGPAP